MTQHTCVCVCARVEEKERDPQVWRSGFMVFLLAVFDDDAHGSRHCHPVVTGPF